MDNGVESTVNLTVSAKETSSRSSEFLARAAFAIRSPINIILGYNELIAQRLVALGDDSQRPYLESIRRAGKQILDAINRILDYSRIENGTFGLRPERLDLAGLVEKLVQDYRVLAGAKKLGLICEIAETRAVVCCDAYCLTNALSNLVDNAIKFTHKGGAVVKLCRDAQQRLCVEVRDTGVGCDAAELAASLKGGQGGPERRYEHSGLGLILTRKYLDLIGAVFAVSSTPGKGSVFTISFPAPLEEYSGPAAPPHDGPLSPAAPLGLRHAAEKPPAVRTTVMVVEDQADQALFMRALLQGKYTVVVADSADRALAMLEETDQVALVLMDVSLSSPEDGLKLTRRIRADRRWKDLPIVVTTANAFAEDRERAQAAGASAYLTKPIDPAELLGTIERLLA